MLLVNQLTGFGVGGVAIKIATTSTGSGSGTSTTVNLPSGIQSGDLIVIFMGGANNWPATFPAGWTKIADDGPGECSIAYRRADGTEGSSISVTRGGSVSTDYIALRLTGVPTGAVPSLSTLASGTSTSPNSNSVASANGLYLAFVVNKGAGAITAIPANYTSVASSSTNVRIQVASLYSSAASDDPGAWTLASSGAWYAYTMGI